METLKKRMRDKLNTIKQKHKESRDHYESQSQKLNTHQIVENEVFSQGPSKRIPRNNNIRHCMDIDNDGTWDEFSFGTQADTTEREHFFDSSMLRQSVESYGSQKPISIREEKVASLGAQNGTNNFSRKYRSERVRVVDGADEGELGVTGDSSGGVKKHSTAKFQSIFPKGEKSGLEHSVSSDCPEESERTLSDRRYDPIEPEVVYSTSQQREKCKKRYINMEDHQRPNKAIYEDSEDSDEDVDAYTNHRVPSMKANIQNLDFDDKDFCPKVQNRNMEPMSMREATADIRDSHHQLMISKYNTSESYTKNSRKKKKLDNYLSKKVPSPQMLETYATNEDGQNHGEVSPESFYGAKEMPSPVISGFGNKENNSKLANRKPKKVKFYSRELMNLSKKIEEMDKKAAASFSKLSEKYQKLIEDFRPYTREEDARIAEDMVEELSEIGSRGFAKRKSKVLGWWLLILGEFLLHFFCFFCIFLNFFRA